MPLRRIVSFFVILLLPAQAAAGTWVYLRAGSALVYRPGDSAPPQGWTSRDFQEDSSWVSSDDGFGIGYGDGDDRTLVSDMRGNYLTLYVRAHFLVGADLPTTLKLEARFDDGFVAYLNGVEVARSHVPDGVLGPDDAASSHEVTDGTESYDIDPSLIVEGDNVLAVEVHNASLGSSDLSFEPVLWGYDSPPLDAKITMGPFLQRVGRRSALVVWETDRAAPLQLVYGSSQDDMSLSVSDPNDVTHHVAVVTDLVPETSYFYRVESARWPSQVGRLDTEKDRTTPFRVGVYGDTRSQPDIHRQVVDGIRASNVDLVFNTGDLVADGSDPGLWREFFGVTSDLVRDVPLYPTLGNHEGAGDLYLEIFELPTESSGTERYYAFRYAVALFVVLDLYQSDWNPGSAQYEWLEQVLSDAASDDSIRHRFVFLHHGPYDSGSHGPNTTAQDVLVPLFDQYGVEIVFSGHDHDYERSTVDGVKYVVTGGGGAPLYSVRGDWWTEVAESVYHYVILDLTGPRLEFTAKRIDGSILDHFVLGDGLSECSSAQDCRSRRSGTCLVGEEGAWACVSGGCIWNCHDVHGPGPDAGDFEGMDGGLQDVDASGRRDGAQGTDGVSSSSDGVTGGCGCRTGSRHGGLPLFLLLVLAGVLRKTGLRFSR